MARETGRTPTEIALDALFDVMEDYEDLKLAEERLRTSDGTSLSLDEVMAKYPDLAPSK